MSAPKYTGYGHKDYPAVELTEYTHPSWFGIRLGDTIIERAKTCKWCSGKPGCKVPHKVLATYPIFEIGRCTQSRDNTKIHIKSSTAHWLCYDLCTQVEIKKGSSNA